MRVHLAVVFAAFVAPSIAFADEPTPPAGEPPPGGQPMPPQPPPAEQPPVAVRPPPPQPPQPMPMPPEGGPPKRGFQIQGRMATQLGIASIVSPGFSLGYRRGNWVFGGEIGITAGKIEDDDTVDTFSLVTLMPMVYYGLWDSRDRRARLDLVAGIGVGKGKLTSEQAGMTTESSAEIVPLLLGMGGDYYLHKNFALGVEVSMYLPVLGKVEDGGMDVGVKGSTQSIHGLLRFTFVTGD